MTDDMDGLYSHASDAWRAGATEGRDAFYRVAMQSLSRVSLKHEQSGNVAAFHAAEDACRALRDAKERADAPKHAV